MSDIRGGIEAFHGGKLYGWLMDRDRPLWRAVVNVYVDSGTEFHVIANEFRADVLLNGNGDGCYGFTINLIPFFLIG